MGLEASPADLLEHMQLVPGVYVIGCLERRVTLYSQQVRALNLIYALHAEKRLQEGDPVVIIGGGAAGVTAAAAAARAKHPVTLLEEKARLLPLQRGNATRWVHPHLYDWPLAGSDDPEAGLPLLTWRAGRAGDVAAQILQAFEELPERASVHAVCSARDVKPALGEVTWNSPGFCSAEPKVVILAAGFGVECHPAFIPTSYWHNDPLHQTSLVPPIGDRDHHRYLISGCGDGGLTDLLRVCLESFEHEEILALARTVPPAQQDRLRELEEEAWRRDDASRFLSMQYSQLDLGALDRALQARRRNDAKAQLHGRNLFPLSTGAAILNRVLASRLLARDVSYRSGEATFERRERGYAVTFAGDKAAELFDQVIIRHGVAPPELVSRQHPEWGERLAVMRDLNTLDQTRWPIYGDFYGRAPASTRPLASAPDVPHARPDNSPPSQGEGGSESEAGVDTSDNAAKPDDKQSAYGRNPYRSLAVFDIEDGPLFSGRDDQIRRAVGQLLERFERGRPAVLRITGESGTGKSSLLRAGILHELANRRRGILAMGPSTFQVLAMRPTDFHGTGGEPRLPARNLVDKICQKLAIDLPAETLFIDDDQAFVRAAAPPLRRDAEASGRRLVIGLDQFEEIVDDLAVPGRGTVWRALTNLIAQLASSSAFGFVLTLEQSRKGPFRELLPEQAFQGSAQLELMGSDGQFLRDVIDGPLREKGFRLEPTIINELVEKIYTFAESEPGARWSSSCLPLLALKLTRLFDHLDQTMGAQRGGPGDQFSDNVRKDALPGGFFDFGKEIQLLAEAAWNEATRRHGEIDDHDVDVFLHPLVRLAAPGAERLRLATVATRPQFAERTLDESFFRHRLLVRTQGRNRLVHEAVIHEWPMAKQWLKAAIPALEAEERLTHAAEAWNWNRRLAPTAASEEHLDEAAQVLQAYRRMSLALLDDARRLLVEYCLAVFQQSQTPTRLVKGSADHRAHVHLAADYGLRELLERFAAIDPACLELPMLDGRRPLLIAAFDHPEVVAWLLGRGVAPNAGAGWTPLAAALVSGQRACFELLLPHAGDGGPRLPGGQALLHLCASHGRTEMAQRLVKDHHHAADARDDHQRTPLHYAAANGHLSTFKYLRGLSGISELDDDGWSALHLATAQGHAAIVEELLGDETIGELITPRAASPLTLAAHNQHAEIVSLLLSTPATRAVHPESGPLLHAALWGPPGGTSSGDAALRTVEALLRDPATDPNVSWAGQSAFELAQHHPRIQRLLLEDERFDVHTALPNGKTPLLFAVEEKNRGLTERILARMGTKLDVSHQGMSTAVVLLRGGRGDLVRPLIASGRIDPWAQSTPSFLVTALRRDEQLATSLLDQELPSTPHVRATLDEALAAALAAQHMDWVQRLLKHGARPDRPDPSNGRTPLMLALATGRVALIEAILEGAGDLVAPDSWGRTAIDYAPAALPATLRSQLPPPAAPEAVEEGEAPPFYHCLVASPRRDHLLALLAEPLGGSLSERTKILEAPLPFYGDVHLVCLTDPAWSPASARRYYAMHGERMIPLTGASLPIHELNEGAPLRLTRQNLLAYVAFFCFFVHGDDGPFLIVEDLQNPFLPSRSSAMPAEEAARLAEELFLVFRPPWLAKELVEGCWRVSSLVYYGRALFLADFTTRPTGEMEMVEDFPLRDLSHAIEPPLVTTT